MINMFISYIIKIPDKTKIDIREPLNLDNDTKEMLRKINMDKIFSN